MKRLFLLLFIIFYSSLSAQKFQNDSVYVGSYFGFIYNDGYESDTNAIRERGEGMIIFKHDMGPNTKLRFNVVSGECEKITLHSVGKYDAWATVYEGDPKDLSYEKYFKKNEKNRSIKHYYLTVNGSHEQYSLKPCQVVVERYYWTKPQPEHFKVELEKKDYQFAQGGSYGGVAMDGVSTLKIDVKLPGRKYIYFSDPRIGKITQEKMTRRGFRNGQDEAEKNKNTYNKIALDKYGEATIVYHPPVNLTLKKQRKLTYNKGRLWSHSETYNSNHVIINPIRDSLFYQFIDYDGSIQIKAIGIEIVRPPVVFVHGFLGDKSTWSAMASQLSQYGFQTYTDDYHSGMDKSIDDQSDILSYYIDDALMEVGNNIKAQKVDVICHSMGGLIARGYVQDKKLYKNNVRKLITVGTPHHGVNSMGYYTGKAGSYYYNKHDTAIEQLHETSKYLDHLNKGHRSGKHLVKGIEYGNIYVHPTDGVVPSSSAKLNCAKSFVLPNGFVHSPMMSSTRPAITTHKEVQEVLIKWLTDEKLERAPNSYIHIEMSKYSSGIIMATRADKHGLTRVSKSNYPCLLTRRPTIRTYDGTAIIHLKLDKHIWGAIALYDSSEIYISHCSEDAMRVRLIRGKALFESDSKKGGHFYVEMDATNPTNKKAGWYKFRPKAEVIGLNTKFAIEFDGENTIVNTIEGKVQFVNAENPEGMIVGESTTYKLTDKEFIEINHTGEKWWTKVDLTKIIEEEDNKLNLDPLSADPTRADENLSDEMSDDSGSDTEEDNATLGLIILVIILLIVVGIVLIIIRVARKRKKRKQ